jgi:hypothetical protein
MANRKLAHKFRKLIEPLGFDNVHVGHNAYWGILSIYANSEKQMNAIKAHLERLGYQCETNGKPGTVGAYHVTIPLDTIRE